MLRIAVLIIGLLLVRFWMRKQEGELSVLGGAAASGS